MIVVGDLCFDEIGVGGHPYLETPNIDRLAAVKAAGLTEVPCLLYDVDDCQAERLRKATNLRVGECKTDEIPDSRTLLRSVPPLLCQSLQTTLSCLHHLSDSSGSLRDRVGGEACD